MLLSAIDLRQRLVACGVSFLRVGPGDVIQGTFGRFGRLQVVLMVFL